jgi:hypothetical protein
MEREERAIRADLYGECEKSILKAQYELEKLGSDIKLTKAATLLSEARKLVSYYLWETENNKS